MRTRSLPPVLTLALAASLSAPSLPAASPSREAGGAAAAAPGRSPSLFPAGADHDPSVPTTEKVLGYSLGDRFTDHAAMQSYMQALSRDATRVFQRTYGLTAEMRALRYLILSHPDNMARLEEIRSRSARLADPRGLSAEAADEIIRNNPVVVWLSYSVHGDEHSSTEAALAVAYHLAAARDEATLSMLRDVVVIVDPAQNPDGRERFITYQRQVAGPAPRTDPRAAEHDQPWPGGRFNHYLFDLNRDWFFRTQAETRGKVAAFLEWMPQVYVDLHEMGSDATYYFAPPADPINRNIPEAIRGWWKTFGLANAAAFDRAGFDYYTGESFDEYYPGYGDSWPTLHGAIGMTYEQASPRGMAVERKDGTILTLREATRHHVTASLSTIATAAAHHEELLRSFHAYRAEAAAGGGGDAARAWIIPPTVPATAARLAGLLAGQGVEVLRAEEPLQVRAAGQDGSRPRMLRFPAGSYIVPVAQPAGRLVTALMETDPILDEKFIGEESERRRLKEDSGFYDVTSWCLPIVTGAEALWTPETVRAKSSVVKEADLVVKGGVEPLQGDAGVAAAENRTADGPADPVSAPYAYLLKYDGNAAAMALVSLLGLSRPEAGGLKVQAAGRQFRVGTRSFPAGSLVLKSHQNPGTLHGIVRKQAETFGVTFYSVRTGFTDEGPDLGSGQVVTVPPPRVAVAYGDPVSPTSYGAIAYLFEAVYGLPFTPIRTGSVSEADLARYNVVILPDASGSPGYLEHLGPKGLERLKGWIESGGTLVTLKRASAFAVQKEAGLATLRRLFKPDKLENEKGAPSVEAAATAPQAAKDETRKPEPPDPVPGAILRVAIEPSRYLGFGYGKEGAVMVNSDLAFSPSRAGRNVVTFVRKEQLRVAGFAWQESLDLLAGTPYLAEETRGRGRVILFSDDPNFRGYWEALNRMFLNSVVFAPAFGETD